MAEGTAQIAAVYEHHAAKARPVYPRAAVDGIDVPRHIGGACILCIDGSRHGGGAPIPHSRALVMRRALFVFGAHTFFRAHTRA